MLVKPPGNQEGKVAAMYTMDTNGQAPQPEEQATTATHEGELEDLQRATQQFLRSLFRAGVNMALIPVNVLPPEPRQHFKAAGREFTRGLATLVREFADNIEKITQEPEMK